MGAGAITGYIDTAQLVLYAFWLFFFTLIFWSHIDLLFAGEGYPCETDDNCPDDLICVDKACSSGSEADAALVDAGLDDAGVNDATQADSAQPDG